MSQFEFIEDVRTDIASFRQDPVTVLLAKVAMIIFALFVAAHVSVLPFTDAPHGSVQQKLWTNLRIDSDTSLTEIFGHGLSFSAALLFYITFLTTGTRAFLVAAGFCAFAWFDDSNSYHERAGTQLAKHFQWDPLFGVQAGEVGQVAAWLLVAIIAVPAAIWYLRRPTRRDRAVALICLVPIVLIGTCAILVDFVHSATSGLIADILTVVEDGGELIGLITLALLAIAFMRQASMSAPRSDRLTSSV